MKALSWWNVYEDIETKSHSQQEANAKVAAVMAGGVGAADEGGVTAATPTGGGQ